MIQGDLRVEKNQFKSELSPFMTNFMTEKLSRLPFSFSWTSPFNYSERKEKKMLTTKKERKKEVEMNNVCPKRNEEEKVRKPLKVREK